MKCCHCYWVCDGSVCVYHTHLYKRYYYMDSRVINLEWVNIICVKMTHLYSGIMLYADPSEIRIILP